MVHNGKFNKAIVQVEPIMQAGHVELGIIPQKDPRLHHLVKSTAHESTQFDIIDNTVGPFLMRDVRCGA